MINNYNEFRHKCLVIPFEEFNTTMDCLYDIKNYPGVTTRYALWDFINNQLYFKQLPPEIARKFNFNEITYDDIAEFFNLSDISAIICYGDSAYVCIIYD